MRKLPSCRSLSLMEKGILFLGLCSTLPPDILPHSKWLPYSSGKPNSFLFLKGVGTQIVFPHSFVPFTNCSPNSIMFPPGLCNVCCCWTVWLDKQDVHVRSESLSIHLRGLIWFWKETWACGNMDMFQSQMWRCCLIGNPLGTIRSGEWQRVASTTF